jgi:inner membrane protein
MGAFCSVISDLDVIGFRFGIRYGDFWGHRGFTHSLLFAALVASAVMFVGFRRVLPGLGRFPMWMYFFLATASHGLLDAVTDGGLGVAFFAPFDNHHYFLPWTPIRVSPIGVGRFFSERGFAVLQSELLWIWLPAALLALSVWLMRRRADSLILKSGVKFSLFGQICPQIERLCPKFVQQSNYLCKGNFSCPVASAYVCDGVSYLRAWR